MNFDYRLRQLESQSSNRAMTAEGLKYATKMVEASGCGLTIEQLANGENVGAIEIVLRAYGLKDTSGNIVITELPEW